MVWYSQIMADQDNYTLYASAYDYYIQELETARKEVVLSGNLEKASAGLPGILEYRYNQLQEIEAILNLLNIKLTKTKNEKMRHFMESYNKTLSSRDAEKFAEADLEVVDLLELNNLIALVRNKYLGIMKALDAKSFQINNITKLRTAGMEDTEIFYKQPSYVKI